MRGFEEGFSRRRSRPGRSFPFHVIIGWVIVAVTVCALLLQIGMYQRLSVSLRQSDDDLAGYQPPKRLGPSTPFVFLHIPKAAGTTITESMKDVFRQTCREISFKKEESFEDAKLQGTRFRKSVELYISKGIGLEDARERTKKWQGIPCLFGHAVAGPLFDARQMLMEATMFYGTRVRYILGHVPFGFCDFAETGCVYVTVLREPVSRLYSHYKYMMRMFPENTRKMCKGQCEDFAGYVHLASKNQAGIAMDNMQTRMISGDGFWATVSQYVTCINGLSSCDIASPEQVTEETLQRAKQNLVKHFAVVATMEHLSLFKKLMQDIFGMSEEKGWGSWEITARLNDNKEEKKDTFTMADLDPVTREKFQRFQKYDVELYDFATKLMFKQYADLTSVKGQREVMTGEWEELDLRRQDGAMDDIDWEVSQEMSTEDGTLNGTLNGTLDSPDKGHHGIPSIKSESMDSTQNHADEDEDEEDEKEAEEVVAEDSQ